MTERDIDEIRGVLARAMSGAPEPHRWTEVERRALSLDAPSHVSRRVPLLTTDPIVGERDVGLPGAGKESDRGGRRRNALVLGVAAAVITTLIAGWLVAGGDDAARVVPLDRPVSSVPSPTTGPTNATEQGSSPRSTNEGLGFPRSRPAAPYDPELFAELGILVLAQRGDVLGLSLPSGEFAPLDDPYRLPDGALGDQRVLDTASIYAGFYVILCCDPGRMLWRNGERSPVSATRIENISTSGSVLYLAVDDVNDELRVGGQTLGTASPVRVPAIIDAAGNSDRVVALVAGADPHLLVYRLPVAEPANPRWPAFDQIEPERVEVPFAEEGPCSIVPVNEDFLVLYGISDGVDRCVGDRAALVGGRTGNLIQALRLPAESRQMNARGEFLTIVTTDGRAIVGRFGADDPGRRSPRSTDEPAWTTIEMEGAVAAEVV